MCGLPESKATCSACEGSLSVTVTFVEQVSAFASVTLRTLVIRYLDKVC